MTVVETHGLGVAWAASNPILESVSLVLDRGLYGLVGANGAGKTTLLAMLSGRLAPHEGEVMVRPRGAIIAYCPQKVDELGADLRALAVRDDALAAQLRGRLALEADELQRWNTLSPGERKRWQVAAALAQEPDVLLLDEPTNHLDAQAREDLLGALRRFKGVGVVVSHDRVVLDTLTRDTLRVHGRRVTLYPGPYSEARQLWSSERAREEQQHESARKRVKQTEARLDQARRAQAAAASGVSTRARMKDKNDSDARSILATTKASWADARAGRVVSAVRGELERARGAVPFMERDATLGGKVFADYERAPNPVLFHLDETELRAGRHVVLRDVRVTIGREERVRIEGPNGAGKTTLLSALVASQARPERLLHLPQELEPAALAALTERLSGLDSAARGRVLSIFAALGSDPERILRGERSGFSPGEGRKLALAEALGRSVWALVLDEPTNHLDLPSIERLEAVLAGYPGCVVLVTHDDAFAARTTTRALRLSQGVID
ncbi:MAG: ABC-F family ATP-binding cassette domain-containing protein [Myxococcales bacterium]|nr:MAG: ABC-F family ATP-binding cassette domain-containing protein [Myxococcales bacterium]